ncbi:MAG: DUF4402 domain-containing protein [Flavobacteriaceae bacterium]|nr:MAG: DUF4402 domain-containing protein [Flavobacteriaceae bacterium]
MNKSNLLIAFVLTCVSMASFGQVFSGSGSMSVEAELVIPLTVTGSTLDFQKVAIPATGIRYYHVKGDGSMFSSNTGSPFSSADGAQTDFEGSPTVGTMTINGTPNTSFSISSLTNTVLTNSDGATVEFYRSSYQFGTASYINFTPNTYSLDGNGEFKMSIGGFIKVYGQDEATPSTPGVYTGTTTLTVSY